MDSDGSGKVNAKLGSFSLIPMSGNFRNGNDIATGIDRDGSGNVNPKLGSFSLIPMSGSPIENGITGIVGNDIDGSGKVKDRLGNLHRLTDRTHGVTVQDADPTAVAPTGPIVMLLTAGFGGICGANTPR